MPPLTPFYKTVPTSLVNDSLTGWASNGWTREDADGFDNSSLWDANGGFGAFDVATTNLNASELTKTLTGLPPDTLVVVNVAFDWFQGIGAPGGPGPTETDPPIHFGATVNGVRAMLPGTISGVIRFTTRTSSTGEIAVRVGVADMHGTFVLQGTFGAVEVTDVVGEFNDIIIDSATLVEGGSQVSITRGSLSFDPGEEWEDYPFPGRVMNVLGLRELVRMKPVIKGNLMMTGERQLEIYRPGAEWGSNGGIAGGRTFTPDAVRAPLATGSYLVNVYCIWKRLRGDYIAVEFPNAICASYGIGSQDGDEGLIPITIEAVQDLTTDTTKDAIPYLIHTLPGDTQVADLG